MDTPTMVGTKRTALSLAELFTPKLVTVLREGYGMAAFRSDAVEGFVKKLNRAGTTVYFTSTKKNIRRALLRAGLRKPLIRYAVRIADALAAAREEAPAGR
jgi:hypothetical protein